MFCKVGPYSLNAFEEIVRRLDGSVFEPGVFLQFELARGLQTLGCDAIIAAYVQIKCITRSSTRHLLLQYMIISLVAILMNWQLIFVDELDRCKPSFAIKLLERIKHYFECECVTFVFSVIIEELQHTVKQYYGSDFNADLYLSRFFDLQIYLPPAVMKALFAEMKITNSSYDFEKTCLAVINYFDLQLRDIQQFYAFAKKTAYKATHPPSSLYTYGDYEEALRFCLDFFLPALVGVRLHSPTSYRELIDGKNSTELIDILCSSSELFYALSSRLNIKRANDNRYGESKEGYARLKEILNQLYEVVFVNPSQTEKEICDMYFSVQTRDDLLRTSSLLSATADFSI